MNDLSKLSDEDIIAEYTKTRKSRLASTVLTALLPAFILIFSQQMGMETPISIGLSVVLYALLVVPVFTFEKLLKKVNSEMGERGLPVKP